MSTPYDPSMTDPYGRQDYDPGRASFPASPYGSPREDDYTSPPAPTRRRLLLPAALFVATCFTTYKAAGLAFALPVMFILTTHELGHFFQALRYRVPASLPYFIPMPYSPFGTMGAVIGLRAHVGNRKALFDIGISGPLAGLVPAIACSIVGLYLSPVIEIGGRGDVTMLGEPLFFKLLKFLIFGPLDDGHDVLLHPVAYAGWVGIFITGLNLLPIGQLDGGHVLYALLLRRAHSIATLVLVAAAVGVAVFGYWGWSLMLALLFFMGPKHPPTADDTVPLGTGRTVLGWLTLAFVVLGFTPQPFYGLGQ
ncbi:MAG TPA: site-2 protease family protein [Pirellulales bacterium]|nr:site-2 protease family protein [Pirellulales bacterium]